MFILCQKSSLYEQNLQFEVNTKLLHGYQYKINREKHKNLK